MKYKWVSFLSKLAFICNLCFLFGFFIMRTHNIIPYQAVNGTIVILAFGAFFVNLILQASMLVLRMAKKDIPVKAWLRMFNITVFVGQIIFFFYLPGN